MSDTFLGRPIEQASLPIGAPGDLQFGSLNQYRYKVPVAAETIRAVCVRASRHVARDLLLWCTETGLVLRANAAETFHRFLNTPIDAKVKSCFWDKYQDNFGFVLEHPSFDEVQQGEEISLFGNEKGE